MVVLRSKTALLALSIPLLLAPLAGKAGPYDLPDPSENLKKEAEKQLCSSTDEYIKTLSFLRKTKDFSFRENASREIAELVSRSCDGGAERFSKIIVLMKTMGFSEKKSLQMALEFAAASPDVQKNFLEIFSKAFLAEFFDFEFPKAMQLAFELSTDYKGDPAKARQDFIDLVRFCKDSKKLDLPMAFCSEYVIKVARISQHFPDGVRGPYLALFEELQKNRTFSFDIKTALEFSYLILKHGPRASENFFKAYDFAVKDLEYDKKKALDFALTLASHSHTGEKPPVLQFPEINTLAPPL